MKDNIITVHALAGAFHSYLTGEIGTFEILPPLNTLIGQHTVLVKFQFETLLPKYRSFLALICRQFAQPQLLGLGTFAGTLLPKAWPEPTEDQSNLACSPRYLPSRKARCRTASFSETGWLPVENALSADVTSMR